MTEVEHEAILKKATVAGLSISAFVRSAVLRKSVRAAADRDLQNRLIRASADQGRLGGLLKHWLARGSIPPDQGFDAQDIRNLINGIARSQLAIMKIAEGGSHGGEDHWNEGPGQGGGSPAAGAEVRPR